MTTHTRSTLQVRAATVFVALVAASLWITYAHGAQAVDVDRGSRDYFTAGVGSTATVNVNTSK